jgi:hypothetical protein
MSIRALPFLVIALILYNLIAFLGGGGNEPHMVFQKQVFSLPMLSGRRWVFTWGDLVILLTLVLLFVELVKATYTSAVSLVDHGLSMLVFIVCLIEFLLVDRAGTSVFFFIMVASLIDVIAGYTIGIRVARRDLNIGGGH